MHEDNLKFSIESMSDFFRLQPLISEDFYYGSDGVVEFAVSLSISGFSGHNAHVMCNRYDLNKFLNELTELEKQRQGSAILESVHKLSENNELFLRLYSVGRGGHMAANVVLQKNEPDFVPLKVSGSFGIDGGYMLTIVSDFENLLKNLPLGWYSPKDSS